MTSKTNTMPFDKTAEQYVLGAMLNSIDAVNHCIPQLDVQDFYISEHQAIFQAITSLYKAGHSVNSMNVCSELKGDKSVPIDYTMTIEMISASIDHDYYLQNILNLSKLRKVIMASNEAVTCAKKENAEAEKIIATLQGELFLAQGLGMEDTKNPKEVIENFHNGRSFQDHTLWAFDQIREGRMPYTGVSCGFTKLDRIIGYFRPGCYYVVGARTSMGKTTFLLNLIRNMNFLGRRTSIGFFSLEMPSHIIVSKLVCLFAGVKYRDVDDAKCSRDELQSVLSWAKEMKDMPIYLEDKAGITISQLRARAKRMLQNHKIEVLFIDYLTLIKPDSKHTNNHLAVNEVSKGIQQLAKELQIPIVVLAQLNRQVAGRTNNLPTLADFRESGSIEEDADACLMLHRPEYYDPNQKPGVSQIFVAKNRLRGELGKVEFNCPYGEVYCELEPVERQVLELSTTSNYFTKYGENNE